MEFRKIPLAVLGCSLTFVTWYPAFGNVGNLGQWEFLSFKGVPLEVISFKLTEAYHLFSVLDRYIVFLVLLNLQSINSV